SANGGINFFLGNNADAARTSVMRPGLEWEELVTALPAEERQGQARWDRWFASQAWRWVRTQPLGFVAGLGRKALQYVNAHEIDRNLDARGFRSRSRVLRLAPRSAWLAPWILLGIAVAWRRGGVGRLVVLFWVSGFAATVLVFVTERYKVDAAPAAIPLALLGASEVVAHLRRGVARHLAQPSSTAEARLAPRIVVMLLVLGAVLAFNDLIGIRTVQPAHASVLEGVAYYKEGRINRAVERLREALEESPGDANAHYQLGTALEKQNRLRAAQVEYEAAGRLVPGNPKPPLAAGWVARRLGERWEARERYDRAGRLDPHNALIHLEMGTLLEELGEVEAARERYRQALALAVDPHVRREASRRLERPGWDRPPPPQPPSGQAPRRGADRRSP
ncbi:MAG: tetratricopeptide repeat protein, partial [Candidatus Krumholzibacteriia bacterium]